VTLKLLAHLEFPGWELKSTNEKQGRHWNTIRKMGWPPLPMKEIVVVRGARVTAPHPKRTVIIFRYGPKQLDDDNAHASAKPVLDRIKSIKKHGTRCEGFIYDDSPKYCASKVFHQRGEYKVRVQVYEGVEKE
jgi:hypothetical protein